MCRSASEYNQTWKWDGVSWSQLTSVDNPAPRHSASVFYHENRDEIFLFGGYSHPGLFFGDFWKLTNVGWVELNLSISPSQRSNSCYAFDRRNSEIVFFGGYNPSLGYLGDTWVFK